MLNNHLKMSLRYLWHQRRFTTLNILGLAIGISACWIIYQIVDYEMSFDRNVPDVERIYQIVSHSRSEERESYFGGVPLPVAPSLTYDITGLELIVPVYHQYVEKLVVPEQGDQPSKEFEEPRFIATLPSYFDLVPYQWLAGSKKDALDAPDKVVLTESRARKYFPGLTTEMVIGKTLIYSDTLYRSVSGIVADLEYPSSFEENEFVAISQKEWSSDNWKSSSSGHTVFVKIESDKSVEPLLTFINKKSLEYLGEWQKELSFESWFEALPLIEKHFAPEFASDTRTVSRNVLYGLIGIAFFLLVLACINYINLSTAQIPQRAREIGILKTLGSTPTTLIGSFLIETLSIVLMATLLSIILTKLFTTAFPEFIPDGMNNFNHPTRLFLFLSALLLITTLLAGVYPAWLSIKVKTLEVIKGQIEPLGSGIQFSVRKTLIVFQFIMAQIFIVSALIIGHQLNYTLKKDLGFTHDAIVNIQMPYKSDQGGNTDPFIYKQALENHPEIEGIALGHKPLSNTHFGSLFYYTSDTGKIRLFTPCKYIDEDYLDLYHIKLLAGTDFVHNNPEHNIIVNEIACKFLGFKTPAEAVGKTLKDGQDESFSIVGVIQDFHQKNLHRAMEPIVLVPSTKRTELRVFNVKMPDNRSQWQKTLNIMEQEWKAIYPNAPFEYTFNDEGIRSLYESEYRMSKLIKLATGITIFISCLGLIGLAMLTSFQRTKEIGIRKVLGASVTSVVALLSKDFIRLVLIAIVIATPIAWYAMNRWLQGFAYRIEMQWWMFVAAGLVAVVIAMVTVSGQSVRAAMSDPIDSLKSE